MTTEPVANQHHPVEGVEFMDPGWCGGCEHCVNYPAPTVCAACSYDAEGHPIVDVVWPCPYAPAGEPS